MSLFEFMYGLGFVLIMVWIVWLFFGDDLTETLDCMGFCEYENMSFSAYDMLDKECYCTPDSCTQDYGIIENQDCRMVFRHI